MKFHHEINILKSILQENIYLHDFVDNCIKEFFGSVSTPKIVVTAVTKKGLMIVLPYLGKFSLQIRTRINRVMKNKLPDCNFRIIFQAKCKLINFFAFKDRILVFLRSGIIPKIKCSGWNATYYGKTKHHSNVRMCEHSCYNWKENEGINIKEHHLFCNHSPGFDDFSILASNTNDFKVTSMAFLINRDHPLLNKNRHSLP